MRGIVIALVFAAIGLAGGTAYLLNSYLSSQEAEFAAKPQQTVAVDVLVAKVDLPVGTVVNDSNTEWQPWPEDAVQATHLVKNRDSNPLDAITKEKHVIRRAISKGDPITMAKLYKGDTPGFMRGSLKPGMRAVAVKASATSASGGFILPGDRVDLMLTHNLLRQAIERTGVSSDELVALNYTSETIMENLRVLAIDQNVDEFQGGAALSKTILLEVNPKQAEKINTAKMMGKLSLVLRSAEQGADRDPAARFTTDVEVSPLLSNFKSFMAGTDPRDPKIAQPAPAQAASNTPPPKKTAPPKPARKKAAVAQARPDPLHADRAQPRPPITVYRGVGASTTTTPPPSAVSAATGAGSPTQ